jgi:hypothetical protein
MSHSPTAQLPDDEDAIDIRELSRRIRAGLLQIAGLACLGLAVAAMAVAISSPFRNVTTMTRVVFSFPGFEKGEYPDKSKFSPDDIRSPEIIAEALHRQGLQTTDELQARVRAALNIEGIIPENITKERDRQRATGQAPRLYVPDEYSLTLTLPRQFQLSPAQRKQLLNEVVSLYREKFKRTYIDLPLDMGKAFESLAGADYYDYDLVLSRESQNIATFLNQMVETARAFRSQRTNLSFYDLQKQNQLFTQIRLNEVLGLIRRDGLSRDRSLALVKMDYYLRTLGDQELRAIQEEKVVQDLLKQAQEREQSYALGIKSQGAQQQRSAGLVVDQGLIDSLLANDAYNFLVREALTTSLKTRRIQADKTILQERRNSMETFITSNAAEKAEAVTQFERSLGAVRKEYDTLMRNIRLTHEDYQQQQYNDAVRISMQARTSSFYRELAMAGVAGLGIGLAAGLGLSLLGISFGKR